MNLGLGIRSKLASVRYAAERVLAASRTALRLTDYARWKRVGQEAPTWDERNEIIGKMIRAGSTVLDVGCGSQSLRGYLPAGCAYQPCDIVQHDPEVWVWNFNKTKFSHPDRRFDYAVCSGVMEYAEDPGAFLREVLSLGGEVILSYATTDGVPTTMQRRGAGWINDLSRKQLESLLATAVPHFAHVGVWQTQEIYRLSSQPLVPLSGEVRLGASRRVTLCGSFGFGNAGDEGAWMAAEDLARQLGLDVGFDLLTRFPKPFMKRVIGTGEPARLQRLRDRRAILLGGGVVDASEYCVLLSNESFLREASTPAFSLLAANVETGKAYPAAVTSRLRAMLSKAERVTVRDELSAETLRAIAPEVAAEVVGDIVLWLTPTKAGLPTDVTALPRYVAVNAPRWKDDRGWRDWIADELIKVSRALDAPLVFVPCSTHFDDDRPAHAELASDIRRRDPAIAVIEVKQHLDPRQTAGLFAGAMLTLGMRLHSCVMSYGNRVPCVGLAYHSKLHGFFRTVGAEDFLLPRGLPTGPHEVSTGFSFADSRLGGSDLAAVAQEAIARFSFDRLAPLKQSCADAFRRAMA